MKILKKSLLLTPDCRRVRDDLRIDGYDNFDYELEWLKEKLK